jgi:hypothetical protein
MKRTLLGTLLLTLVLTAAAHEDHASHGGAKPDVGKMWQDMLKKPALSPSAAFDAEGTLWLAEVKDGFLLVSRSNDKGKSLVAPVEVNRVAEHIAADGENRPKIVIGKNGAVYVSYTASLDKPFTGNVRFSRSLDGGKHFSEPVTVNDNRDVITHRFEALGVNDRGQVYLAWLDKRDAAKQGSSYKGAAVYAAVSDDGGATFRPNLKLADHSCECCRVAMAMDRDGVPVVFWRHIFGNNVRDHALLRLDGKSEAERVSYDNWETDSCPHHGPSISIGADGAYHLVWFDNAPAKHGLFYARREAQGGKFSTPLAFGDLDAQPAHPFVLAANGHVTIVWKEFDGERSEIYAIDSTDNGASWSARRKLAATAGGSDHPLLIANQIRTYLFWNTVREGLQVIPVTAEAH